MNNIVKIFLQALKSTGIHKRWWILALAQSLCLIFFAWLNFQDHKILAWVFIAALLLALISSYFWLDIKANFFKQTEIILRKNFFQRVFFVFINCLFVYCFFIFLLWAQIDWIVYSLVTSIVLGTLVISLLNIVLLNVSILNSWQIAFTAWSKKVSLAAIFAFILMLCKAFYFMTLGHLINYLYKLSEFSVFRESATIWVLLFIALVIISFFSALLNVFLVFLFLETLKPIKELEEEKSTVSAAVAVEQNV